VLANLPICTYSLRTFEIAITRSDVTRSCLLQLEETFPRTQEVRALKLRVCDLEHEAFVP
jgi:hypothetical protein